MKLVLLAATATALVLKGSDKVLTTPSDCASDEFFRSSEKECEKKKPQGYECGFYPESERPHVCMAGLSCKQVSASTNKMGAGLTCSPGESPADSAGQGCTADHDCSDPVTCVSDVCCVRLYNHGYAIFPRPAAAAVRSRITLEDNLFSDRCDKLSASGLGEATGAAVSARPRPRPAVLGEDENPSASPRGRGTEVPQELFPPTPDAGTPCWQDSDLPKLLGSHLAGQHGERQKGGIWTMPLLTPSTLGRLRSSEHNTFIHMSGLPSTPQAGSSSRSSSVPRDIN